jgi:hypothetical protein
LALSNITFVRILWLPDFCSSNLLVQALGQYSLIRHHIRIFLQGIEKFCV